METISLGIERKGRAGKTVTILEGFTRHTDELKKIARTIKVHCGSGGTVKATRLEFQGDQRKAIALFLKKSGFGIKETAFPH